MTFILQSLGLDFILGQAPYWLSQRDDIAQAIAGFNMFFSAPWNYPALAFDGVNYPNGTRLTFVDAIPIYALALKVLLPKALAPLNPFGFWVGLSFVLQGVGAWLITRALRIESWFFLLALLTIFLCMPALMMRLGHTALLSHWVIIFAIALYIYDHRQIKKHYICWSTLIVASFYIHVYLFAMVSLIYIVSVLGPFRRYSFAEIGKFALPFVLLTTSLFLTILPFPLSNVSTESGFGTFSMNTLSPFLGGSLLPFGFSHPPGQGEGYNYLGLGVLVALVLALLFKIRLCIGMVFSNRMLFILLAGLTAYSLSNHIYVGNHEIFAYKLPFFLDGITSQFRASGRFFWPVGYIISISVILVLYRGLRKHTFGLLALTIIVLQIADLRERYSLFANSANRTPQIFLDYQAWDSYIPNTVKHLYFYPKFTCGQSPHETLLPVMRYSADRQITLNTGYIARYKPECNNIHQEIAASDPLLSAYIFSMEDYPDEVTVIDMFPPGFRIQCAPIQFARICRSIPLITAKP